MKRTRRTEPTFASLDAERGVSLPPEPPDGEFPLPAWYRRVHRTPLSELTVEDVCRACRQEIHVEHIVPIALEMLGHDPLAGEMYDGELIESLGNIPTSYWASASEMREKLGRVLARPIPGANAEVQAEAAKLLERVLGGQGNVGQP